MTLLNAEEVALLPRRRPEAGWRAVSRTAGLPSLVVALPRASPVRTR
ncbi:hypothetical protein [Streptomyces sp. WAC07061]|nr:hypothetical protein [Streptomyces sp. WAC07061]